MKKLIGKICKYFEKVMEEVRQFDECLNAMRKSRGEDEEAVDGIQMTKPNEVPHIAIGSGKFEDGSTFVAINYIDGGTNLNVGERCGEIKNQLIPIYVMQFFQSGSVDSLIVHANWAKENLTYKAEDSE